MMKIEENASKRLIFECNFLKKKIKSVVYVHFNCVTLSDSSPGGQDECEWWRVASMTLWNVHTHSRFMNTSVWPHLNNSPTGYKIVN